MLNKYIANKRCAQIDFTLKPRHIFWKRINEYLNTHKIQYVKFKIQKYIAFICLIFVNLLICALAYQDLKFNPILYKYKRETNVLLKIILNISNTD